MRLLAMSFIVIFQFAVLAATGLSETVHAVPTLSPVTITTGSPSTCGADHDPRCPQKKREQPSYIPSIFGISRRMPALLSVRGGQVLEPETLEDVEALILKAASEQKLVVIDFSAVWCGPCKIIAPLFKELSDAIPDVVFLKVDVDENPDTAAKYNVSAMPTFVFIKAGEVVDRLMGANPARLQELIDEHK